MVQESGSKRLLSREEARAFLGIGSTTLWKLESQGRLPATRIGKRVLFQLGELERFVEVVSGRKVIEPAIPESDR